MISTAKRILPFPVRQWLRTQQRRLTTWPPIGLVRFGNLRRLTPISRNWGFDRGRGPGRGQPIDRYYIEKFLARHSSEIRGRVLEFGDDHFTLKFGGSRVTKIDVLHYVEDNPKATIVADITCADQIPSDIFDCVICTQTLQVIYDTRAAMHHLHRILKPGGVLLVTTHGISKIACRYGIDLWGEYWRFTGDSARRIFQEVFEPGQVTVEVHGNVLSAIAFLHGLASDELKPHELDYCDPDYEVLITLRAVKQ